MNCLYCLLHNDVSYGETIEDLTNGRTAIGKVNELYWISSGILIMRDRRQDVDQNYWRIVVPEYMEAKNRIVHELHMSPTQQTYEYGEQKQRWKVYFTGNRWKEA